MSKTREHLAGWTTVVLLGGFLVVAPTSSANTVPTATLFVQLQPPNTVFSVDATDADGDVLTYEWNAQIECGTFTPNSPTDDQASWNHPSGEPPAGCPHEEGTDHAGVISVIVRDGNDGSVQCTHEGSGDGEHDCNIYGEEIEDCIIDMRLVDGMNGSLPPDEDEVSRGALTVMNRNDTDSQGGIDAKQDVVVGEKDLMKLRLFPPDPNEGGTVTLEIPSPGSQYVKVFKRAHKRRRVLPADFVIPTGELPKTLWVEGVETSPLRGVSFRYFYAPPGATTECEDNAVATIVWANLVQARHDASDGVWAEMTTPPSTALEEICGGFGVRPVGLSPRGVRNCIGFQFQVLPLGVQDLPGVMFDITRQKRTTKEIVLLPSNKVDTDEATPWPSGEKANDDSHDGDESNSPNAEGLMYSFDGPGSPEPVIEGPRVKLYWDLLFREFVRVRFDGVKPTGNKLSGTRSSGLVRWTAHHTWFTTADDGIYRTTGDATESDENYIRLQN